MATFRVETVSDPETDNIYAKLYYPSDSEIPIAETLPIYSSHELAEKEVLEIFKKALNTIK